MLRTSEMTFLKSFTQTSGRLLIVIYDYLYYSTGPEFRKIIMAMNLQKITSLVTIFEPLSTTCMGHEA